MVRVHLLAQKNSLVVQFWLERLRDMQKVVGSNPTETTKGW